MPEAITNTMNIITRIYRHANICLSMLSPNVNRTISRQWRLWGVESLELDDCTCIGFAFSRWGRFHFFLTKFEVFIFSFLTHAGCKNSSVDYYWKKYKRSCRLCRLIVIIFMLLEGKLLVVSCISHFPARKTFFLWFSIPSSRVLADYKYLVEER